MEKTVPVPPMHGDEPGLEWRQPLYGQLVLAVQQLSLARTVEQVAEVVRHAARQLVGADGATFVLRERNLCYYADEEAIAPLWKGRRFPMETCISGWVMLHAEPAVIEDIYADPRIPVEAYRPTFVQSLAMLPIRRQAPIGAIGCYWATHHRPDDGELWALQALADSTSVALENVALQEQLADRSRAQTAQHEALRRANAALERSNAELQRFAHVSAHDLQSPLRGIGNFVDVLQMTYAPRLDAQGNDWLRRTRLAVTELQTLVSELVRYANLATDVLHLEAVALGDAFAAAVAGLEDEVREADADVTRGALPIVTGDRTQLTQLLSHLIGNGLRYRGAARPHIHVSAAPGAGAAAGWTVAVRDNGIGIAPQHQRRIFEVFQRLHDRGTHPGTGIGLAMCRQIVQRHGGRIWVESEPRHGSVFYFTLPATPEHGS